MSAGERNKEIEFYQPSNTRDAGESIPGFTLVGADWAKIASAHGSEAFEAARQGARRQLRIMVLYRDDVQTDWAFDWKGERYNIKDVDRSEEHKGELWITGELSEAT